MSSKRHRPARPRSGRWPAAGRRPDSAAAAAQPPTPSDADSAEHLTPEGERAVFEQWSAPLLVRMSTLPPLVVPAAMLVLTLAGLAVGGVVGFVLLAVVALFLAWLAVLSWPLLRPRSRVLRALVPLAVLASAFLRL